MELFIEQIDNEILRDKKKKKAEGYSVERRGDRRAAESQCYRHITENGKVTSLQKVLKL